MRLHRVLADEQLFGDLAVAQPRGDELEDFVLSGRYPERLEPGTVDDERSPRGWRNRDRIRGQIRRRRRVGRPGSRQPQAEPDAAQRKDQRNQPSIDLERVLDDQEAVLDQLEDGDEGAAKQAEKED